MMQKNNEKMIEKLFYQCIYMKKMMKKDDKEVMELKFIYGGAKKQL